MVEGSIRDRIMVKDERCLVTKKDFDINKKFKLFDINRGTYLDYWT